MYKLFSVEVYIGRRLYLFSIYMDDGIIPVPITAYCTINSFHSSTLYLQYFYTKCAKSSSPPFCVSFLSVQLTSYSLILSHEAGEYKGWVRRYVPPTVVLMARLNFVFSPEDETRSIQCLPDAALALFQASIVVLATGSTCLSPVDPISAL